MRERRGLDARHVGEAADAEIAVIENAHQHADLADPEAVLARLGVDRVLQARRDAVDQISDAWLRCFCFGHNGLIRLLLGARTLRNRVSLTAIQYSSTD